MVRVREFSLTCAYILVYAFRARATTDYLSIFILALYVTIALSHVLYTMARGHSSRTWEKLEEFVVMVLNSRQEPILLANTCAGIERTRTIGLNSRILVMNGNNSTEKRAVGGEEEEVQLVFTDEQHGGTSLGRVVPDAKYGTNQHHRRRRRYRRSISRHRSRS